MNRLQIPRTRVPSMVTVVLGIAALVAPSTLASAAPPGPPDGERSPGWETLPGDLIVTDGDPIVIKLATLAPRGSAWHEILKQMGAEWHQASGGQVTLRIFPSGVAGEETDILRLMGTGQLQAGSLSLAGLSRISPSVYVLAVPMAMRTWDDLARVRAVMQPRLEEVFKEQGYILLNWGDIGWVHFFLPDPNASLASVREHQFVAWSDDSTIDLWKDRGFRNTYVELAQILPALQQGRVDAVGTTPLFMLANRWYPEVPYMVDMPWTPLVGATLIDRDAWNAIPADLRPTLMEIARQAGIRMQEEIQRMEADAIEAMRARGLKVVNPDASTTDEWRAFFESGYPDLRGPVVPEAWFDEVLELTVLNR
jgi:TRAP-type C4-dicarboxylate transport system substrate-binding protein